MRVSFILIFTISFITTQLVSQQEFEKFDKSFNTSFIQVGEELIYEVKYLFFALFFSLLTSPQVFLQFVAVLKLFSLQVFFDTLLLHWFVV